MEAFRRLLVSATGAGCPPFSVVCGAIRGRCHDILPCAQGCLLDDVVDVFWCGLTSVSLFSSQQGMTVSIVATVSAPAL